MQAPKKTYAEVEKILHDAAVKFITAMIEAGADEDSQKLAADVIVALRGTLLELIETIPDKTAN